MKVYSPNGNLEIWAKKPEGYFAVDEWNELHPAPKPSFDELKEQKLNELESISSSFDNNLKNAEMVIKSSLGFAINADLRSQNNIRGLLAVIGDKEKVAFMDAGNSVQTVTKSDLNTMLNECALNGQNLYLQKWAYKEAIANAKDESELNAIEIKFEMMDFSK